MVNFERQIIDFLQKLDVFFVFFNKRILILYNQNHITDEIYQIMKAKKKKYIEHRYCKKTKNSKFCECEQIINLKKKQTNSKHSVYL